MHIIYPLTKIVSNNVANQVLIVELFTSPKVLLGLLQLLYRACYAGYEHRINTIIANNPNNQYNEFCLSN